jgi:uncharacterized protein YgiM (DUF1202 family)
MKVMNIDNIERQKKYVAQQKEKGPGLGIVFADAFLRGMRDIGYKSPAWALAEELDNSFQAGASTVSIRFGFEEGNKTQVKPDQIAIVDDGNGMIPEMIGYAVRWGGTDREGDRTGFGRYGYGLPSSLVSIGKRYTVYSKANGAGWHAVTVDIDELAGAANDMRRTEQLLAAKPAELPEWILSIEDIIPLRGLKSGTVIVVEDMDRLRQQGGWIKAETLRAKLLRNFGIIYRHSIPERRIYVQGDEAQAIDPLFLMEHSRFFNETSVMARSWETAATIEVETSRGTKGEIRLRAALLPPDFQLVDPAQYGKKGAKNNKRFDIMKEFNGLLICRAGRQIDCIQPRWTVFQNIDRNIKIEIDFDAELDEFYGITTAKQQIVIADEMWEKLQHAGKGGGDLINLVKALRAERDEVDSELKAKVENASVDVPRPSEAAMEASEKFKGAVQEPTPTQQAEAEKNLEQEAKVLAAATGKTEQETKAEVAAKAEKRKWAVTFGAIPEGPFYRPKRMGTQKQLIINTDHPFHSKVYEPASLDMRSALEVLLFVLAERELECRDDAETFYKAERNRWSERLRHALEEMTPTATFVDKAAAVAEKMYEEVMAGPATE